MQPGKQLHISMTDELLDASRFVPVRNDDFTETRKKPEAGTGFWTSSFREETQDSAWVAYLQRNDQEPFSVSWYLLTPREGITLYIVDNLEDLFALLDTYTLETPYQQKENAELGELHLSAPYSSYYRQLPTTKRNRHFAAIDFERLAQDYDGMWLTEAGKKATHLSIPHNLNGWDSESVLWFRWCFTQIERIETPTPVMVGSEKE